MKFLALFLSSLLFINSAHAQEKLPRLKVSGNALQTVEGKPVTLRGVSLCSLDWHNPLGLLEKVSSGENKWAANVVRLPVQEKEWRNTKPEKYIQSKLDPAVKICRKNNIYCIIDWHAISDWNDPVTHERLKNFWDIVAPRYAADKHIIYEIFNEPTEPKEKTHENWLAWRTQAQKWIDSIRAKAPHTVLLVGSPHWSQMPAFAVDDPFKDKNLMYVMHLYPNLPESKWDRLFGDASKTLPIFISEWGWTTQEKAFYVIKGTREKFADPLRAYLDARPQISWTAWSYDPKCGPAMLGHDSEMGDFVKNWLSDTAH